MIVTVMTCLISQINQIVIVKSWIKISFWSYDTVLILNNEILSN